MNDSIIPVEKVVAMMCSPLDFIFQRGDAESVRERYSDAIVWKEFQKILAGAGLEHHRVHDLRHH